MNQSTTGTVANKSRFLINLTNAEHRILPPSIIKRDAKPSHQLLAYAMEHADPDELFAVILHTGYRRQNPNRDQLQLPVKSEFLCNESVQNEFIAQ
jgi:hypothetical protein